MHLQCAQLRGRLVQGKHCAGYHVTNKQEASSLEKQKIAWYLTNCIRKEECTCTTTGAVAFSGSVARKGVPTYCCS
jgi:hypothetical protein